MKNLLLVLFVMTAVAFSNDIHAQTACTPAQKEACKKICGDMTTCTPEQMAACKKICSAKSASAASSASAEKVVNKAPAMLVSQTEAKDTPTCQKKTSQSASTSENVSPVKLVGLEILPETNKKAACSKPCSKVQE